MLGNPNPRFPEPPRPQPTGRYLVLFHAGADMPSISSTISDATGARTVAAHEIGTAHAAMADVVAQGDVVVIDRFKVAVIEPPPAEAGARMNALAATGITRQVRPEFFLFAISDLQQRYAAWVREGLQMLAAGAMPALGMAQPVHAQAALTDIPFADDDEFTWGLRAVGADRSRFAGRGIRIAVLDTGLDFGHPDFAGRAIVRQSFVAAEPDPQDGQGHGTHTAGTIAGPRQSQLGRRYGVAPEVELHIGKVLDNSGSGMEGDILRAMNWAIDQKCVAISMSLGRAVAPGEAPDPVYEEVGAAALREDSLIIAAAGNESARAFRFTAPVGAPANSSSVMAVAAVDPQLQVAPFSCGGINPGGGEVNISGPGMSVYSSFPRPRLTRLLDGTSMACPHVAGVAALWAESDASLRGKKLWDALERSARELGSFRDYGRGLVQAPGIGVGV
jgi:subtilisin